MLLLRPWLMKEIFIASKNDERSLLEDANHGLTIEEVLTFASVGLASGFDAVFLCEPNDVMPPNKAIIKSWWQVHHYKVANLPKCSPFGSVKHAVL